MRLIREANFRPEVVQSLSEVFDAEWAEIERDFDGWRPPAVEAARTSLARIALHLARRGTTEPRALREKVHSVMKRSHAALADRAHG
jgi:hypothetical protein